MGGPRAVEKWQKRGKDLQEVLEPKHNDQCCDTTEKARTPHKNKRTTITAKISTSSTTEPIYLSTSCNWIQCQVKMVK